MWPVVGYFLDAWNSGFITLVTVSTGAVAGVLVGRVEFVVEINTEATKGMVCTPTGVSRNHYPEKGWLNSLGRYIHTIWHESMIALELLTRADDGRENPPD